MFVIVSFTQVVDVLGCRISGYWRTLTEVVTELLTLVGLTCEM